jgi:hypothetical protein
MKRLRACEYVPSPAEDDARLLRGLPLTWEAAIDESALDGLQKRAAVLATSLAARGCPRDAADLRRRLALVARAAALHEHAANVETLAQLYRALSAFAKPGDRPIDASRVWVQSGALAEMPAAVHGPAFRETAALRNRAFRWVEEAVAKFSRAGIVVRGPNTRRGDARTARR